MGLNWVSIVWSMAASASLTLATIHLLVWLNNREAWAYLLFTLTAAAAAAMAFCELLMMQAQTPEQYGTALRWLHVPAWAIVVALTGFVLIHLRAGRPWLAWTVCGLRTLSLLLNFVAGQNLNFREITRLRHVSFLGESISVAEGVANPWMIVGQLSLLLLVVFVVDAAITAWRRGDRRQALATGASIAFCVLASAVLAVMVVWNIVPWPFTSSLFFMAVVAAMSYGMSHDVVRAAQVATQLKKSEADLRQSEQRFDQATQAAGIGAWEWNVARDEIWATEQGRVLFGFPPGQQIDFETIVGAIRPDDRHAVREQVTRALEGSGSFERECRVALPEGGWRWIITRGRVEADTGGKPALVRGVTVDMTERKRIEERFQRVTQAAPFGIMTLNRDGKIDFVNARMEADFGYSLQELVGQSVEAVIPGCMRPSPGVDRCSLPGSLSAGGMARHEAIGRRKDGSEVPLEIGIDPIEALDGSGLEILLTIVDISERKQNEDALKRERAFLRQVIDIDPNLIFAKDRQGRFTLANRAVADIYGTTVDALIGKTDADFDSNVEEVESFRRADLEVMNTLQEQVILEEQVTDAAGKIHYLQTVKRPIVEVDGTANQLLGTSTDITARRAAEQSIRLSEEFNRTVLASLHDEIAILDQNAIIVAVNDAWKEFAQRNGAPCSMAAVGAGVSYVDVCEHAAASGEEKARQAADGINSVLRGEGDFFLMEYSCDSPSEPRWFLMRVLPLKRKEGGVVISHSDITQRKAAELELIQQRNELAHFSRVTMLGELSGSLAHELNQPLAAILSNAQAALRFLADDNYDRNEVREILQDIVSADKRAGEVIQGLRLLLKKSEARHAPLELNELVRDVLRLMRSDVLNARVDLTLELAPGLAIVNGDRVQLEQVLLNLVMNGCDAMMGSATSERQLVITTERIVDDLRVSVIDRGPGIPPDDLERVFEPFYTTKAKGLGLGLVVSRQLIAAHGGRLHAENNAAGGAVFCFTLPASFGGTT